MANAKVKPELVTDQDYLPSLLSLLDKAKKKVDVLSFSFAMASMSGKMNAKSAPYAVAARLVELAQNGIQVRLYIEGHRETSDRNAVTARFLRKGGVEVVYGATHAKGFCVDDRFVFFGSTNLTQQSITKNNEANVLIDSRVAARQFEAYFEHLWEGGEHGGVRLRKPFLADQDFAKDLIDVIDHAKKTIYFSIYFFDQDDIRDALIRAHDRGVQVNGFVHQHFSFGLSYIRRNFKTVKALKAAGIEDVTYSQPHTFSHSKYLVADGREVLLGTGNWLDEDIDIHPQLYVHLSDLRLARALIRHQKDQVAHRSAERLWSGPRTARLNM